MLPKLPKLPKLLSPGPAAFVLTTAALVSPPAAAQNAPPALPFPPATSSRVTQAPPANRPRTLRDVLDTVVWDPAQRGPLLIIAPEKTMPIRWRSNPLSVGATGPTGPTNLPDPDKSGRYRLVDVGDYFGRRARIVGRTLTVFAPTTMTVLPSRLPKPDPYAGMGPNEKLRLFQSTLTAAQWRTLGSADGIGVGDLDPKQRALYLSLLPDPFEVWPVQRGDDGNRVVSFGGSARGVTLTPAQRQSVRLSLRRLMDWSFLSTGPNGGAGRTRMGIRHDDGAQFELRGNGFGANVGGRDGTLFDVPLLQEVPAKPKPGQLPFSWSALDAPVSLDGAATVGELVKRAAAQTRVSLFCDPRYADLSVFVRSAGGGSVRAGDLLEALGAGVTGTFRRVGGDSSGAGASYLMTDDLEGLGARHARVQAWVSANSALAQKRADDAEDAIARAPLGESVVWDDGDPNRPGAALAEKLEAHRKKMADPNLPPAATPAQREAQSLVVPVTELPQAVQATIRRQLENHAKTQESRKNDPFFQNLPVAFSSAPLDPDRVALDLQVRAAFIVPGMGRVSGQGSGYSTDAAQSLTTLSRRARSREMAAALAAAPTPAPLPAAYKQRALIVAAGSADDAARAVAAAKAHGMNQVWIEARDGGGTLAAAIAAGKKANIAVGAVVRLLRVPGNTTLPTDRNLLGETTTEYAARRTDAPFAETAFGGRPALTPPQEAERLRRLGDWLLPDSPVVQADALKRAAAAAATPGLAGLVLRDVAAPGYDDTGWAGPAFTDSVDGAEQMGYTVPVRQAFLRETGIDPIDLSPLANGRLRLPFGASFSPFLEMQLPFFPDYGPNPRTQRINDRTAAELGAKDGPERWNRFRAAKSALLTQSVVRAVRSGHPSLAVWVERGGDTFSGSPLASFFDAGDAPVAPGAPPAPGFPPGPPHSPQALLMVRSAPSPGDFPRRLSAMLTRVPPGWEGIVLDLSEVPLERALPLLEIVQEKPAQ